MQEKRISNGGLIDRSTSFSFTFNGKKLSGYKGDTLASALLANGVDVVSRSFKYHRPRGIVGAGAEEPNAIVQIGTGATTEPNIRATQVMLYDGLVARTIKGWPSLEYDVFELLGLAQGVIAAGFYNKTFMGPSKRAWHYFEKPIRQMSAMGESPRVEDPDHYVHQYQHCDVLVAGAGPSGLAAAIAAARAGARVIIADEQNQFGGSLRASCTTLNGKDASVWIDQLSQELHDNDNVRCLVNSTVFAYHDHNFLTIVEKCSEHLGERMHQRPRQRIWKIRAKQVILAQGAFERPLVFCNNDRPGVMTVSAVSKYLHQYAVKCGQRAVVFTNNDGAYQDALDLQEAGTEIVAIVDSRHDGSSDAIERAQQQGIEVLLGHVVDNVKGRKRVNGAYVSPLSEDGKSLTGSARLLACDLIAMSGGWSPAVHLHSQAGGKNQWDETNLCFVPGKAYQACRSVGSANGEFFLSGCIDNGFSAGMKCAELSGFAAVSYQDMLPQFDHQQNYQIAPLWRVPSHHDLDSGPKQFIDYQNDVGLSDVRLAVREGYKNIEHVKRYTALGFGTDQGKLGNINGMAALAELLDEDIPTVGTTTFRPNYTPVTFGAVAGEDVNTMFEPVRKTALHTWHVQEGAPFEVVGQWHRPWYFPKPGEDMHAAVNRECLATRASVGIMDASTLGKIEVYGPDAREFLEKIYTHDIAKLEIGRCAYGIMLSEDGMVKDDGVMARIGENHYYLTTTTGGAATVFAWLEHWLQTEWPEFEVYMTSTTDHNSTIAVVGPNSRKLLEKLQSDLDFSKEAFAFMSVKSGVLAQLPVQVFRISFSGELAFEINIDSNYAMAMWQKLIEAGGEFDITPYGTETLHVLRAEKGFVIIGQDTDGSVTPVDLSMNWLLSKTKDYLGRRSLAREDCLRPDRKQLVGLLSVDEKTVLPEGVQLIEDAGAAVPVPMCGHVTSSYFSACLGHPIALALVVAGKSRHDEIIYAALRNGERVPVRIGKPVFYDIKGDKQRV